MTLSRGFRCTLALVAAGLSALAITNPASAVGPGGKLHPVSILTTGTHATNRPQAQAQDSDEAESIQQRAEFEQSIAAAPAETAPTAGLMAATQAASSLAVSGGTWRPVTNKPFINDPISRGANYGEGYGLITGRMTSFTSAGRYVFAGSASGGVWRSSDNGAHWQTINRGLPRLAVGALATNPRDGSVWVGTGEANNASENQYGTGIYRLARGSDHWVRVGGTELYGAGVHRIAWIRGYVYAATSHGLYRRSVSAARTSPWRPVLQPAGPRLYPPSSDVTDIIAVPGSRGRQILAVVGWSGYSDPPQTQDNGFYVGTGGRGSFNKIVLSGDINSAAQGRTTFSSSHGWLYAVVSDTRRATSGVRAPSSPRADGREGPGSGSPTSTSSPDRDLRSETPGAATTPACRLTTTSTSSPTRATGSTSTCCSKRCSNRPTAVPAGARWLRTGTRPFSAATRRATRPMPARPQRTPTSMPR